MQNALILYLYTSLQHSYFSIFFHRLVRGTGGGFGFTVVWTRPPRVERVAQGGSAERAGLRAGDYIVFVGNKNVVTVSEEEVRSLVK